MGLILTAFPAPSLQYTHYAPDSCDIIGDTNLLGTGVRIGFYLLAIAADVSFIFSDFKSLRRILRVGTLVSLILVVFGFRNVTHGSLALLEWTLVVLMSGMVALQHRTLVATANDLLWTALSTTSQAIVLALSFYVYYWAAYQGRKAPEAHCNDPKMYIWVIIWPVSFNMYSTVWIWLCRIAILFALPMVLWYLICAAMLVWVRLFGASEIPRNSDLILSAQDHVGLSGWGSRFCGRLGSLFTTAFSVITIELIVQRNHIDLTAARIGDKTQFTPIIVGGVCLSVAILGGLISFCLPHRHTPVVDDEAATEPLLRQ